MSPLTKIFVVLQVILSIILAAGAVVWVNRQENYNQTITSQKGELDRARTALAQAKNDADAANSAQQTLQVQYQNMLKAKDAESEGLRSGLAAAQAKIAELESNTAQLTAANKSSSDALAVAQKTLDTQSAQLDELRKSDLDLQKRYAEANFRIDDLTNKYEVTDRQARDFAEQNTQLQADLKHAREVMHQAGVSEANPRNVNGEPLVRVAGVVRSKETIGGVPMATISVGSADQVTKGMQFKVIDPNNSRDPFLGYLIVDRVEPNQAIGHLTGPRIGEVHPGVEVRTQL